MEHLILILCLSFVFTIVAGLHLYTMKKVDSVQMTLLRGSKEWRDLDNASMACIYTVLMLVFFSLVVGIILHKFVMFELFLQSMVN